MDRINKKSTAKKPAAKKAEAKAETTAPEAKKAKALGVVLRPFVTEKAAVMQSGNKYTFMVAPSATKMQVKYAVSVLYNVNPRQVHIINVQGKAKRRGNTMGRRSDFKKAVVTLPEGQSITIHEGV